MLCAYTITDVTADTGAVTIMGIVAIIAIIACVAKGVAIKGLSVVIIADIANKAVANVLLVETTEADVTKTTATAVVSIIIAVEAGVTDAAIVIVFLALKVVEFGEVIALIKIIVVGKVFTTVVEIQDQKLLGGCQDWHGDLGSGHSGDSSLKCILNKSLSMLRAGRWPSWFNDSRHLATVFSCGNDMRF